MADRSEDTQRARVAPMGRIAALGCALGLLPCSAASAQFGATAEVEQPIPAGSEQDPTAAATVVEREDRLRAGETTDELMDEVPGARARRTGALGSFTGLSLRGADLDQTTVLLGDVPLGPADGGAFDLSTIPLSMLERVEVYRGGAPLALGAGNVGGVVRLVPREQRGTRAEGTLSAGSFGLLGANAAASVAGAPGTPSWNTVVGARHSDGDYPYLDDGGTRFDDSDDVERRRQNARLDEAWGLARMQAPAGDGTLDVVGAGYERTGGLTGSPVEEPTRTRRNRTRTLGILSWGSDEDADTRVRVTAASGFERNALADRLGEIALPRLTDDRTVRGFARADVEHDLAGWLGITALGSYTVERHDPDDALAQQPVGSSVRHTVAAGAEARLHGRLGDTRVELRPSALVEVSEARLHETRPERAGERDRSTTVAPTARLGLVVEPWRGIALSGSVATQTRGPTIVELFGDRAFLLGDTRLDPERSVSAGVGAMARGRAGPVDGSVELRGFGLFVRDMIRYVRTSQFQLVPQNVDRARVLGAELGARGRVSFPQGRVRLTGALTLMDTEDRRRDRDLPLRPWLSAHVRPALAFGPFGALGEIAVYAGVTHVAANYADPANVVVVPSRTLVEAGASAELLDRLRLELSVRDALDTRPFDLVGFPLPGRTVTAQLTLHTGSTP